MNFSLSAYGVVPVSVKFTWKLQFIVIEPQPELVLKLFLNLGKFELRCFYKVVHILKNPCSHSCEVFTSLYNSDNFRILRALYVNSEYFAGFCTSSITSLHDRTARTIPIHFSLSDGTNKLSEDLWPSFPGHSAVAPNFILKSHLQTLHFSLRFAVAIHQNE